VTSYGDNLQACNKLSMKLKFHYRNHTQRFYGLKGMMLHASMSDKTMMREPLAYSIFREMGLPTVRQVHISTCASSKTTSNLSLLVTLARF